MLLNSCRILKKEPQANILKIFVFLLKDCLWLYSLFKSVMQHSWWWTGLQFTNLFSRIGPNQYPKSRPYLWKFVLASSSTVFWWILKFLWKTFPKTLLISQNIAKCMKSHDLLIAYTISFNGKLLFSVLDDIRADLPEHTGYHHQKTLAACMTTI